MKSINSKTPTSQSTNLINKFFRITAWAIGLLLLIMLGVYVYVNSEAGQRKVSEIANKYISDSIETPYKLGKIGYSLPDWVSVTDIYFADQSLDTLFAANEIKVDIDMFDLFKGKINIDEIRINNINVNVKQTKISQEFNYQFLINAFAPVDTSKVKQESSKNYKVSIDKINVDDLKLAYLDEITAIYFISKLKSFHVSFNQIDLDKNSYNLKDIKLETGFVTFHTGKPSESKKKDVPSEALAFNLEHLGIEKVDWTYNGEDIGLNNKIRFDKFDIDFNKIDLPSESIDIEKVRLDNSELALEIFQIPPTTAKAQVNSQNPSNWKVKLGELSLKNNKLTFDDLSQAIATKGLDPAHISLSKLNTKIQDLVYTTKQTSLDIEDLRFVDKSTFRLDKFRGKVLFSDRNISLADFKISTPQSSLDFDTFLSFSSLKDLSNSIEKVKFDISFNNCIIGMKDVSLLQPAFVPDSLFGKLNLKFDTQLKGTYGDFVIDRMKLSGLENTEVVLNGKVRGLDNFQKLQTDLVFTKVATTRKDIEKLAGKTDAFNDFNIPEELLLKGKVFGNGEKVNIIADLKTSIGQLAMNGALLNLSKPTITSYEGTFETEELMVNKLLKQDYQLGRISTKMDLSANAAMTDIKANGQVSKVYYNGYDYSELDINFAMKDSLVNLIAKAGDKNFNFVAELDTDLKNKKMPAKGQIEINNLNLQKTKLYELPDAISGFIKFDMNSTLPERLEGTFVSERLIIGSKNIGQSKGSFTSNSGMNKADFSSKFLDVNLATSASYTQLTSLILAEINKYYRLDSLTYADEIISQSINLNVSAKDHPIWSTFVPELKFTNAIELSIAKGNEGLKSIINFESLQYQDYALEGFKLAMNGNGEILEGTSTLNKFVSGTTSFDQNELNLKVESNKLLATYLSKPQKGREPINKISFSIEKYLDGARLFLEQLRLESINYGVNDAPIFASTNGIQVNNLVLSKGSENMVLNADFEKLAITLNGIEIHPFAELAGYASYDLNGKLFGDFYVENYMQDYVAKGSLGLKKLRIGGIDNGDVNVLVSSFDADQIVLEGDIKGSNMNAKLNGRLGFQDNFPLDFIIDIERFDTKLLEQYAPDAIKSAGGIMTGKLSINGTPEKPNLNGKLDFEKVRLNSSYLGTLVRINNQAVNFKGQLVTFDNFVVLDSLNQQLKLNGKVNWADLDKVSYDLALETKNFLLLDAKKGANANYFGKANIDAKLTIKGIGEKPTVGGNLKVNGNSDVTIIMPSELEDVKGSDIVTFIPPKDYISPDSLGEAKPSRLENFASLTNEIIIDIETDPRAQLAIVVDEFSGDNIKVKGKVNLTAGIYPSGELFLIGIYEIASGSYDFSLEILKRNFQLEKGGTIIWSGDPYKAMIQLQAFYEVNADIQSLNSLGLNVNSYGKVPIDVLLKIDGTIENPLISFELRPSEKAESSIKSIIENNDIFASLRRNESEMNRQVFSLLVLNKFFNEQNMSSGTVFNSEAIARQSVSKLLTEQLNMLAGDFLGSVGLNFGLNSDQLSTENGDAFRTNLNIGLKKSFLNERVRVSVGKNFELENTSGLNQNSAEILDNIEVAYNITPDGRYAVKVYRNNQFQTVLEGFVLETGVSFVLTGDYNSFGELFNKKKSE